MRFASYERSECFIEVVRLLLHIGEVDVSLKNIRVFVLFLLLDSRRSYILRCPKGGTGERIPVGILYTSAKREVGVLVRCPKTRKRVREEPTRKEITN